MSRQRKLIRTAAADTLKNNTAAGANVFSSRSQPLWEDYELPAISIYGESESISIECEAPRRYRRELELKIEVAASGADADDQLDDIGDRIERLIGRSNRLTYAKEPTVAEIMLTGERLAYRQEGKSIIGSLVITYGALYYTGEPDEEDPEPLDDLNTVTAEYNLANSQAKPERASDLIELSP